MKCGHTRPTLQSRSRATVEAIMDKADSAAACEKLERRFFTASRACVHARAGGGKNHASGFGRRNGPRIWRGASWRRVRQSVLRAAAASQAAGVSRRDLSYWGLCDRSSPHRVSVTVARPHFPGGSAIRSRTAGRCAPTHTKNENAFKLFISVP
jgi:hypothetical protein